MKCMQDFIKTKTTNARAYFDLSVKYNTRGRCNIFYGPLVHIIQVLADENYYTN